MYVQRVPHSIAVIARFLCVQTTRRAPIEINIRVVCIVQQATATTTTRAILIASRIINKTFLHRSDKDKLIPAILAINAAKIQIESTQ